MEAIPALIWFMWALNIGLSLIALVVAIVLNKKNGGGTTWL